MHQYNMGAGDHEDHGNNNNNNQGGGGGVQQVVEDGGQVISSRVMERPSQEQIQLQAAAALKCPRCDSTNTKFCYYNNYSLSQPRHFCKACKRYWTRGGTLRNVPVGGGCRKNKRFRRPLPPPVPLHLPNNSSSNISSAAAAGAASCSTSTTTSTSVLGGGSGSTAGGSAPLVLHESMNLHQFNPLFYGGLISDHHHQISNFPFSRYDDDADLHRQQAENLGLGFSSSSSGAAAFSSNYNAKQQQIILQDHLVGNSNYPSLIGSSNGGTTSSTISSLLMGDGGGDQQKQIFGDSIFQSFNLPSFDNHHQNMHVCKMVNNGQFAAGLGAAGTSNSLINVHHHHDHMGDSINDPSSSSNSLIWSTNHNPTATNTNWLDPSSNVASSSVPSLI